MEEERKIEKWLRAYAKKRRGQAKGSFDLHPATRRMLQDEIARQAPTPEGEDDSLSLWEVLRQQWALLLTFAACIFLIGIILLPVLNTAKEKAQNTLGMAQLKQIGEAVQMSAAQNEGRLPESLDELTNGYLAKNDLSERGNGKPIVYMGAGKNIHGLSSNTVLAYSMENKDTRDVLFASGQTALVDRKKFEEATNADLSHAVAMNNRSSLQSESSALVEREITTAGNEPAPSMVPPPESPVPEASPASVPSPPPPTVAAAIPEPNSMSESLAEQLPTAKASSDLAVNSASTPPAMAPPPGVAGEAFDDSAARRQSTSLAFQSAAQPQFASQLQNVQNAFQNSVAPSQALPVLSNFQIQQNGNALRIVDQDGSVYVGSWRLANVATVHEIAEKAGLQSSDKQSLARTPQTSGPPAVALADNLQAAQNYLFHVSGMNRTLKQDVVFTGNLLANFAVSGNLQQSFGGAVGGAYSLDQFKTEPTNQTAQLPWSNLRIAGTAVINRTNHVEVNAMPVAPAKQN